MVICMKTTVEIPDSLLAAANKLAARQHTTIRALIEQGLRHVLGERKEGRAFRLRKATFNGEGLQPDVAEGSWDKLRDLAYKGRGA